ncbi:MAG: hypothetical protein ABFS86_18610, partial [Planctomycetota bacterium]
MEVFTHLGELLGHRVPEHEREAREVLAFHRFDTVASASSSFMNQKGEPPCPWLLGSGFVPAVPTINTDAFGTNVMGNTKPALFRSDRDMFSFFYSDQDPGDDGF